LQQDWNWVRPHMATLLQLVQDFTRSYTTAKREQAAADFHDLEQFALRLLWDVPTSQPTNIAGYWQKKLRYVFVDEYQDINAVQDRILTALCRNEVEGNRFLVGDMKQSIYRFRLANPKIFQGYARHSGVDPVPVARIWLSDNFRSREKVLDFINSMFSALLEEEIEGVVYDEQAKLVFGRATERRELSSASLSAPCVELHLRLKSKSGTSLNDEDEALEDLDIGSETPFSELNDAEKEAHLVATRLLELKNSHHQVGMKRRTVSGTLPGVTWWCCCALRPASPRVTRENFPG